MKTTLAAIIVTILNISTFSASGQDTAKTEKKIKEYFLTLVDISPINVSVKYKRQLKNQTFLKIGLVDLSADASAYESNSLTSYEIYSYGFSAGLECGIEFRKTFTDKLTFFHGPNISFTYDVSISLDGASDQRLNTIQTYNGGIPYTLGLLFNLNKHFILSAEINPELFFNYRATNYGQNPSQNYTSASANFRFTNKYGLLSLAYRI